MLGCGPHFVGPTGCPWSNLHLLVLPPANRPWPGAARAGVENLTRSLAVEWAESGVRVNSLAPGSSIFSPTASDNYSTDFSPFEMARPGVPAKRLGTTLEVTIGQEILILMGRVKHDKFCV